MWKLEKEKPRVFLGGDMRKIHYVFVKDYILDSRSH